MRLVRLGSTDRWVNPDHVVEVVRELAAQPMSDVVSVWVTVKMVGMPLERFRLAVDVTQGEADTAWSAFVDELAS